MNDVGEEEEEEAIYLRGPAYRCMVWALAPFQKRVPIFLPSVASNYNDR